MKEGLTYSCTTVVDKTNTAAALGSGTLYVFSTPAMIALMENASFKAIEPSLNEGETTVGTSVNILHLKASPMGETIKATATLTKAEGRHLYFDVIAEDSSGIIGKGTHERFIVNIDKFLSKLK